MKNFGKYEGIPTHIEPLFRGMGIPVPGDGKPLGTSFPVNVLPGAAGLVSERPPAQNGQPLRAARPIVSTFFNIFQVFSSVSTFFKIPAG